MLTVKANSDLAGVRNLHLRLGLAVLSAVCVAAWAHGRSASWILVAGLALLAIGAGLAALWSP